jgi:hypothetical protein
MERIDGPLQFGKLLWYDPNPADNEPIRLEDLTISVDLEVTSKTRSIILVNKQAGTASVNSNGTQTVVNVNFFEGSAYNDERALTTHYTDIQNLNNTLNDDYEALNIESINIDFNSSYAPMIKIKFIDIRGAAMFSRNGEGKYKFFFELPYPIFHLTIKGFYGKSVQYCIHLLRFNASFNAQTGNFEIDCDFIGFTYALLADMLMGIVRGSVGTVRGKAIFQKIKGEYKNQDAIITVDELVARISEVNEKVGKIKSGEEGKQLALVDKSKSEVENLRQTVLTFLDTCQSGQEIFTRAYSNGILIISTPDSARDGIINTAKDNYKINSAKKINDDIKKLINFDTNIAIKQALDINNDGICPNFTKWDAAENVLEVKNIPVTKISNTNKLTAILESNYYSGNRLTNMITLLQSINYSGTDDIRIIDLSSAIKACDTSIAEIEKINSSAIKTATDSLKTGIKEVLGFDPTIRNLFRVLCISTEVFLECMVDISKEAEIDNGGKRAVELNKLRNGLNDVSKSNKIFPWPEYRKKSADSDGYYEEWMGNEPITTANVPELQFTEELLDVIIEQKKQDLLREEELTGSLDWYPISVIDTPVDNGLGDARLTVNPYKIGLMEEIESNTTQPKGTADEALRVMMYRAFLLLGVVNRNDIKDDLIKLHARLEAENLYETLKKMPVSSIGVDIKNSIINSKLADLLTKFSDGTPLDVSGDKMNKPFFKDIGGGKLEYRYIWHESSDRSVIPVNGYFSGEKFFSDIANNTLLSCYDIRPFRDAGALYVGNSANHVRTGAPYDSTTKRFKTNGSSSQLDAATKIGIENDRTRRNYQVSDGAVYVKIVSDSAYNDSNSFLTPTFGKDVLSGYNAQTQQLYGEIANAIDDPSVQSFYDDPISGNYLANQYSKIDYTLNTANYSIYTGDYYTGVDPSSPGGGVAPSFIAFFNEAYDRHPKFSTVDRYGFDLADITYNGFASNYDKKYRKSGWHEFNNNANVNLRNGLYKGLFTVDNTVAKDDAGDNLAPRDLPYLKYGENRQVLNNKITKGEEIFIPKIEFAVDTFVSYSLFGTRFYNYQYSVSPALSDGNGGALYNVNVGDASKALLFLHCFPFQGVTRKDDDVWDRFMFDFNSADIQESSPNKDNPSSEVLGIKSLFRFHNAFIEAPKIWTLFMGAILWRIQYYNIHKDDPIEWYSPPSSTGNVGMLIPGMRLNGFPRTDQYLTVVLDESNYIPAGMHFNSAADDYYPLNYALNSGAKEPVTGAYSRVDETIMGLPEQVKSEFINKFLSWVSSGFKEIQEELEIKFKKGTPKTTSYLSDYESKWNNLSTSYKVYPDTSMQALEVDKIKSELGENIYQNYIMVCPVNVGGTTETFEGWTITGTDIDNSIYVKNQYVFNMELNPNGQGMDLVRNLLLEKVYIQNVAPKVWNPPNIIKGLGKLISGCAPITVKKDDLDIFVGEFIIHLEKISKKMEEEIQTEEKEIQQALFNTNQEDKIKLNLYRTLMSIYQKWVGGLKKTMFTQCGSYNKSDLSIAKHERNVANEPRLIDSFRFLDRSFNDIGDAFYMNPEIFYRLITKNTNASFFDVANKVLSENNFNFIPLPSFVNFNDGKALADIFEPYPYNDVIASGPSFVCVYAGQSSTNLDLGATSNYPDDGVFIRIDADGNFVPGTIPEDLNNLNKLTVYETNAPVFTVNYGQQNQNYFKDVKLDQKEFAETAESLEIIDDISQGGDKRKSVMVGQNLFNTYQTRSYSCEVEMLGCALVQPMMYFQLNNVPMWRGLYLIINVSHSIKPNSMTTTFKGVRVKKTKTPLLSASDVLMNLVGDVSSIGTGNSKLGGTRTAKASIVCGGVTKSVKAFKDVLKIVVDNLEGAYCPGGNSCGSSNSGETLWGLDKDNFGSGGVTMSNFNQFWTDVTNENKSSWNNSTFPKPSDKPALFTLYEKLLKERYELVLVEAKKTHPTNYDNIMTLVDSDGRLKLNLIYAAYNGPGWFAKFFKMLDKEYSNNNKTSDGLLTAFVDARTSNSNSLIANTGMDIRKLVGIGCP